MSRKSNYHHGDLRSALLDAGDAVLAEQGFRGFTLRECARQADVSHAAPKHHFNDARGFLTAIAVRGYDRLTARLQATILNATTLTEEFEATTMAYLAFAEDYPEHFRIMFRSDLLDGESKGLKEAAKRTFVELTNVILRQRGDDEISTLEEQGDFDSVIRDIVIGWSHIHGFAHLVLEQQLNMVPEVQRSELIADSAKRLSALLRHQ